MPKQATHQCKTKLEQSNKQRWGARVKRWMWRVHCECGWASEKQRARRGAAVKEGRAHQKLQGVES